MDNKFKWDGERGEKKGNNGSSESRKEAEKAVNSEKTIFEKRIGQEWLTTQEAAEYLRISAKSLWNLTSAGKVRYYKLGRRNRFLLSDLKGLFAGQSRGGSYGY